MILEIKKILFYRSLGCESRTFLLLKMLNCSLNETQGLEFGLIEKSEFYTKRILLIIKRLLHNIHNMDANVLFIYQYTTYIMYFHYGII